MTAEIYRPSSRYAKERRIGGIDPNLLEDLTEMEETISGINWLDNFFTITQKFKQMGLCEKPTDKDAYERTSFKRKAVITILTRMTMEINSEHPEGMDTRTAQTRSNIITLKGYVSGFQSQTRKEFTKK